MKACIIHPETEPGDGGRIEVKEIDGNLESLQAAVGGGYIEAITFGQLANAYVDEDGKSKRLPINHIATALCTYFGVGLAHEDFIAGPLVVVGSSDGKGEDTRCPQSLIDEIRRVANTLRAFQAS